MDTLGGALTNGAAVALAALVVMVIRRRRGDYRYPLGPVPMALLAMAAAVSAYLLVAVLLG